MKQFILTLTLLLMVASTGMSQFATSKYANDRGDFQFAKTTYGNPMFENKSSVSLNDAGTFRVGAYLGFLLSRLREKDYDFSSDRAAVIFGAMATYQFSQYVYFMSGLMIALNGTRFDYDGADGFGYNFTTLVLPLLVGYAVIPDLIVFAGFQLGFLLAAEDTEGDDLKDYLKGLDFGFKFGLAYQITELFRAQAAYTLGLSDVAEDDYEGNDIKTGMFEIGLVYNLLRR